MEDDTATAAAARVVVGEDLGWARLADAQSSLRGEGRWFIPRRADCCVNLWASIVFC